VLRYFSYYYYTIPIQILLNLIFIIVCLTHFKKIKGVRILLLYSSISFIQSLIGVYTSLFERNDQTEKLVENSINLFMLFEFIIFYEFIIRATKSALVKWILNTVRILFCCIVIYYWKTGESFNITPCDFTISEGYLIIIPCLYYYYELFDEPATINLSQNSKFWVISGMLFFFIFITPLYLQSRSFFIASNHTSPAYSMTFIAYIILYIFFLNALKCQIRIQNQFI
jgi:hypothetical protein